METGPIFSSPGDLLTVYGHASGNPGDATDISFNVIQINEYPNSDGNTCQFSIIAHEFNVYGSVQYYSPPNRPVPDADIFISSLVEPVLSNEAGNFTFLELNAGAYEISPSKPVYIGESLNYFDGLSSVDASRIARFLNNEIELDENQKHAASLGHYICKNGNQTELAFTSLEACTANGYVWTPNITAQSHANIAKYAAGIIEDLGVFNNTHWLFIDPQGAIMNIQGNGSVKPYSFYVIGSNIEIPTFKGIRLGDVTGNWSAPPDSSGRISQELIPGELNLNYTEGKTFSLPIYLPDATEIEGIDMALAFDPEVVRFTSFHFSNDQLHSDDIAVVINEHHSGEVRLASYALRQVKSVQGELGYVEFEVIADKATQSSILITELFVNEIEAGGFLTEKDGSQFITSTMEVTISRLPLNYALNQNYPNPFNPVTHIDFELSQDGIVTVSIFDMKGALIEHLVNGWMAAGYHQVTWQGNHLSSGLYIVRMDAAGGEVTKTIKMTMIK